MRNGRVELDYSGTTVNYADQKPVDLDAERATTEEILNRPARAFRYQESRGATRDEAAQAALHRLDALIEDNLMLAQRLAESEVINAAAEIDDSPVVAMRRIIHPELSRSGSCGLCIAASDRLYTVRELLPIHANCKCTSAPVTMRHDPADALNKVDLGKLYQDTGGTSAAHLKRTRYQIDQHGELGPTLVPAKAYKPTSTTGEKSTSTAVITEPETAEEVARRHLPILEANLAKLRADGLAESTSQVRYHKAQIGRFRTALSTDQTHNSSPSGPRKGVSEHNAPENASGSTGGGGGKPPRPPRQNMPISGDDETPAERLSRLFAPQTASATADHQASVWRWQNNDDRFYEEIQRAVDGRDSPEEAMDVAIDLQELMTPLPEPVEVWRGIRNVEAAFGLPVDRLDELVGHDRDVPMFFATSLDRDVAESEFTRPGKSPALYKIAAQPGTPAVWAPPLGSDAEAYQQELLFPPGVVVRILRIDRTYSVPIVEVEVRDGEVGR